MNKLPRPQIEALRAGVLDIGLLREPPPERAGFAILGIHREPLIAVVPRIHALSELECIPVTALANEPFILFPAATGPAFHSKIIEVCAASGFQPRVVQEAGEWATIVGLVACGVGVSLAPACVAQIQLPGVTYRELTGSTPLLDVVLTWRDDDSNPALLRFVEAARETTVDGLCGSMP